MEDSASINPSNRATEEFANISKKTATEQFTLQHMIELQEAFVAADQEGRGELTCEDVHLI